MSTNPAEHRPADADPESAFEASPVHHRPSAHKPADDLYGGDDDLVGPSSTVYPHPPTKDDEPD
ncbi:hypothetical protein [Kitasatospora sp. NPDC085879]|uniref:hypothetical protein n=1 Tax=Kitasatospora sp. NPDC085879 TaxID=3154769 RepID=UPI000BB1453C|nr:hypothetical protein [Streptomyces sp. TLI_235]PBC67373.1 hypothetical protein BX265_7965 [Streptomyces sp. TLI_235]